jgi:RNA ligase
MELYPTISNRPVDLPIYAFDKLDGSNIRAEWSHKTGFSKFGTRKRLLDPAEPILGEAVTIFRNKYEDDLQRIFKKQGFMRATVFMEFAGEHSFAGFHENEPHDLTLFDLHVYKKGLLPPKEFLTLFEGKVETIPVLYTGKATQSFIDSVKNSDLAGMTFEGVVCKGGLDNRRRPVAFKVKSHAWLDKLKNRFADDEATYLKLM